MDNPFIYNRFVVGNDFLSREKERNILTNLLRQKQHALIYDAPKTGKTSLVQQSFLNLQKLSYTFNVCTLDLSNVRSKADFLKKYVHYLSSCVSGTLYEWNEFSQKHITLSDIETQEDFSQEQIAEILSIPERIYTEYDTPVIIYIEDFQNILTFDDGDDFLKTLETEWANHSNTTYLITGSQVNAMKFIFEEEKYFYNFAEHIVLSPIEQKMVEDHIIRTFLKVGRVVEQSLARSMYLAVDGHPWYVWQLATLCFNLTKGYMSDKIIEEGIKSLISTHEIRFRDMVSNLSNYQVNLLKAIFDGATKFTSTDVLSSYHLNSSANVHRLKEALKKKEIATFDSTEKAVIIDPLFKTWLEIAYFTEK